jgi:hypothetical protein
VKAALVAPATVAPAAVKPEAANGDPAAPAPAQKLRRPRSLSPLPRVTLPLRR